MQTDFSKLKTITFEQLLEEYKCKPMVQRRRRKDNAPMVDRFGQPIMVEGSGPPEVPAEIRAKIDQLWQDAEGFVLYRNMDMSSSQLVRCTAVRFGAKCDIKSLADMPQWLNDLPSQRQYPEALCKKEPS